LLLLAEHVAPEPQAGEARHLLQRAGLLEEVPGAPHDGQPGRRKPGERLPVEDEDLRVAIAHDEQRRRGNKLQRVHGKVGAHAATAGWRDGRRLLRRPWAKATSPPAAGGVVRSPARIASARSSRTSWRSPVARELTSPALDRAPARAAPPSWCARRPRGPGRP